MDSDVRDRTCDVLAIEYEAGGLSTASATSKAGLDVLLNPAHQLD